MNLVLWVFQPKVYTFKEKEGIQLKCSMSTAGKAQSFHRKVLPIFALLQVQPVLFHFFIRNETANKADVELFPTFQRNH